MDEFNEEFVAIWNQMKTSQWRSIEEDKRKSMHFAEGGEGEEKEKRRGREGTSERVFSFDAA